MRRMPVAVLAAVLVAAPWKSALASGSSTRSAPHSTGSVSGVSQISKDNLPRVVPFERDTQAGAAVAIDLTDPNRIVAAFPQQMFPGPYYPWGSAAIGPGLPPPVRSCAIE